MYTYIAMRPIDNFHASWAMDSNGLADAVRYGSN